MKVPGKETRIALPSCRLSASHSLSNNNTVMQLPLTIQAVDLVFKWWLVFPDTQFKIPKDLEKEGNKKQLEKHVFY